MKKKTETPQVRRFIETARQLECDEDKERFEDKLGKIAKVRPKGEKSVPQVEITIGALPAAYQQLCEVVDRLEADGKRIVEIQYPQHARSGLGIAEDMYRGYPAVERNEPYPARLVIVVFEE